MLKSNNFPDAVPELFGTEVDLRELCEADIPAWFSHATDAESADLAGDAIPASIEAGANWLHRHRERFRQRAGIRWAIVMKGTSDSVGTIGLTIASESQRTAELGVVVARANWRKGVATSATQLVVRYAFDTLGLGAIQAGVLQRNLASTRLLEKTGFRLLRAVPADPKSETDSEDCFLYALQRDDDAAETSAESL